MDWLTKKEMGLPIWAWGIIAAVILFLGYRWFSNRSGGSSGSPAVATGADLGTQNDQGYVGGGDSSGDGSGITDTTPPPESAPPEVDQTPADVTPPAGNFDTVLPHDTKQKKANNAQRNITSLRNSLKKAVTKQAVPKPNAKKKVAKPKPVKVQPKPELKKAAPVSVAKKSSPAPIVKPKIQAKPTPPRKVHK